MTPEKPIEGNAENDSFSQALLSTKWNVWSPAMKRIFLQEVETEQRREVAGAIGRMSKKYGVPEWMHALWIKNPLIMNAMPEPGDVNDRQEAPVMGVICIVLSKKYVTLNGFDYESMRRGILEADLPVRAKIKSGPQMALVYEKSAIEALPYVKTIRARGNNELDDNGELPVNGKVCVGIKRYAVLHGLSNDRLEKAVTAAGLVASGSAKSGANTVDVYDKAAIEALPYVAQYKNVLRIRPDWNGEVVINGVRGACHSTFYTGKHDLDFGLFTKAIDNAKLPVIGKVRNGTHIVPVYEKEKVELLPYIKERVKSGTAPATPPPTASEAIKEEIHEIRQPPPANAVPENINGDGTKAENGVSRPAMPETDYDLWNQYKTNPSVDGRNALVERYLYIVDYYAQRIHATLPGEVELGDIKAEGVFGLLDAIEGYDLRRGVKFETFCVPRIRGAILDALRRMDWVPKLVRSRVKKIATAVEELETQKMRQPEPEELAVHLGIDMAALEYLQKEAHVIKKEDLHKTIFETESGRTRQTQDFLGDPSSLSPDRGIEAEDGFSRLLDFVRKNERTILTLKYKDGLTMKKIGGLMGLSEARISQIHSDILENLRQIFLFHVGNENYFDAVHEEMGEPEFQEADRATP